MPRPIEDRSGSTKNRVAQRARAPPSHKWQDEEIVRRKWEVDSPGSRGRAGLTRAHSSRLLAGDLLSYRSRAEKNERQAFRGCSARIMPNAADEQTLTLRRRGGGGHLTKNTDSLTAQRDSFIYSYNRTIWRN